MALSHGSLGMSPSQLEVGWQPRMSFDWHTRTDLDECKTVKDRLNRGEAQLFAQRTAEAVEWAHENLGRAQERQAKQANKIRCEPDFGVDDLVYLSKNRMKVDRPSEKLGFPNPDPYAIKEQVGHLFKLELPSYIKAHLVFHAGRLRKAADDPLPHQYENLPTSKVTNDEREWEVERILNSRSWYGRLQYKADWTDYDPDGYKGCLDKIEEFHKRLAWWRCGWSRDQGASGIAHQIS